MAAGEDDTTRAALAQMDVRYEAVPLQRAAIDPHGDLVTTIHLARRLRALRPDVFLGYTIKPVVYGGLAARLARVPRRWAMITGLGYAFLGQEERRRRALASVARGLYRLGLSGTTGVIFQNPDDLEEFRSRHLLPHEARAAIVRGSGVDTDHYGMAPLPLGPLVFVFVGRLLREKGILDFVEMARRVRSHDPAVRFLVVGGIDPNPASISAGELESWVAQGTVEYLGELSDVRPALAAAHALVLPSYREGTPRSVLEAMSVGRPIITTDVPGCRETIVDSVHGYLVPVRDPGALTRAALRLADRSRLEAMAGAARSRAVELYDARAVAREVADLLTT